MESQEYMQIMEFYAQRGIGRRLGFGESPAVLVIDFIRAFTDSKSPLGSNLDDEVENSCKVLKVARSLGVLIIFTTVQYQSDGKDAGIWPKKAPAALTLVEGSEWVELDPRLQRQPDESLIVKKFASAFFGTHLTNLLTTQRIDTLILLGCTTSGCIRATAIDALQYGYRAIVPEECVGDRAELPHRANLFDIDSKYGDVVTVAGVLDYFQKRLSEKETSKGSTGPSA